MEKNEIKEVVRLTIAELLAQDLLRGDDYETAAQMIRDHYRVQYNPKVADAIASVFGDKYATIIPLIFQQGMTQEALAEEFECEVSTIGRNKKRLCLEILRRVRKKEGRR